MKPLPQGSANRTLKGLVRRVLGLGSTKEQGLEFRLWSLQQIRVQGSTKLRIQGSTLGHFQVGLIEALYTLNSTPVVSFNLLNSKPKWSLGSTAATRSLTISRRRWTDPCLQGCTGSVTKS